MMTQDSRVLSRRPYFHGLPWLALMISLATLSTFGCDDDGKESSSSTSVDESVVESLNDMSVSDSGPVAVPVEACELGDVGCACDLNAEENAVCADSAECIRGFCMPRDCEAGEAYCFCRPNLGCDTGLACNRSVFICEPTGLGALGQPCIEGSVCREGLTCDDADDTCQAPDCPRGEFECGCTVEGECNPGSGSSCASDGVCREAPCYPGEVGCGCTTEGNCEPGAVCDAGLCAVEPFLREPIIDDLCLTPCRSHLTTEEGELIQCEEGLMEICLDRQVNPGDPTSGQPTECRASSCLVEGEAPPRCDTDRDCPSFQTCVDGLCGSNCRVDGDCFTGRRCHQYVCRVECDANSDICPYGHYCDLQDGETGLCLQRPAPRPTQPPPPEGDYTISSEAIGFHSNRSEASLFIQHSAARPLTFTVRKLMQTSAVSGVYDRGPLEELSLEFEGEVTQSSEGIEFTLEPGRSAEIKLFNRYEGVGQWSGSIEVVNEEYGTRRVSLVYMLLAEGEWRGQLHYFNDFDTRGLSAWISGGRPTDLAPVQMPYNALVRAWIKVLSGELSFLRFQALMSSVLNETWDSEQLREACYELTGERASRCYAVTDEQGYAVLSEDADAVSIPRGVTSTPLTIHALPRADQPSIISGRVESATSEGDELSASASLLIAGDPYIELRLDTPANDQTQATCVVFDPSLDASLEVCYNRLNDLSMRSVVGGRYVSDSGTCASGYTPVAYPWLVDGFNRDVSSPSPLNGRRYRYECRHGSAPLSGEFASFNANFSGANPIPDGSARARQLELVDGMLINQGRFLILFREALDAFPRDEGGAFERYGVIELELTGEALDPSAYESNTQEVPDPIAAEPNPVSCSDELIDLAGSNTESRLSSLIAEGSPTPIAGSMYLSATDRNYRAHYVCHDTGRFDDCGARPAQRYTECPQGSGATYFLLPPSVDDLCDHSCNANGTCLSLVSDGEGFATPWLDAQEGVIDAPWRCAESVEGRDLAFCEANRADLREGKRFLRPAASTEGLLPSFRESLAEAFRYRFRFAGEGGEQLGFTPEICDSTVDTMGYCYNPDEIDILADRVECALSLYESPNVSGASRAQVTRTLSAAFSGVELSRGARVPGFETLYAELMTVLGNEAMNSALTSRFKLDSAAIEPFLGEEFEVGGVTLDGVVGHKMNQLYRAAQYYELALDRFSRFSPQLWSIADDADQEVFTEGVIVYLSALLHLSSQRALAYSEIASEYERLNEAALARRVVERAYVSVSMSSAVISSVLHRIEAGFDEAERVSLSQVLASAGRVYQGALLKLQGVSDQLSDEASFMGIPFTDVPFPTIDSDEQNAFEKSLRSARQKTQAALADEREAIEATRNVATERSRYEQELARQKRSFEDQLAKLCGTFVPESGGAPVPAIPRYASGDSRFGGWVNPCGGVGQGAIHDALVELQVLKTSLQSAVLSYESYDRRLEIEQDRAVDQCEQIQRRSDIKFRIAERQVEVSEQINERRIKISETLAKAERDMQRIQGASNILGGIVSIGVGIFTSMPQLIASGIGSTINGIGSLYSSGIPMKTHDRVSGLEREINDLQNEFTLYQAQMGTLLDGIECERLNIDSRALIANLFLQANAQTLEVLRASTTLYRGLSNLEGLINQSKRLIAQYKEAEERSLNVGLARSSPMNRIFKSDAIANAERTFDRALTDVYRTTRVFEYYTSQSYAQRADLFRIRMVERGDAHLERYLDELEDAYREFEDTYGLPDVRVQMISLRDDILAIPTLSETNEPLSQGARQDLFLSELNRKEYLNGQGYLAFPFATRFDTLSPFTRDHKILRVEADISGGSVGDPLGRLYLRQRGTGSVYSVNGDVLTYRLPERLAVINPSFNGVKPLDRVVYQNARLRDRPLVNSQWELVFNHKDERVNLDIDLNNLADVKLYVYYTDFTAY